MRTTPYLTLSYGGMSYDGGQELIAGQNLAKISNELTRLGTLAGFPSPAVFDTAATVNDGGQESAARDNLLLIQAALTAIGTAAGSVGTVVLQVGLDATNGGRDNVMVDNLLKIDAECQRLAAVLDGGGEGGNTLTFVAGVVVNDAVPTDPQYDWGFISPTMVPPLPLAYGTQTGGATDKVFMITTGQMGPIGNPAPASKRIAFGANGAADDGLSSVILTTPAGSYTFEPMWMDGGSLAYWGFNGFDVTDLPALLEGETFTVELVYA